jgi:DNA primase large subunit
LEVKQVFTAYDRTKYPFVEKTAQHVREIGLDIDELESEVYTQFMDRAEKRITDMLLNFSEYIKKKPLKDPKEYELEIFSFPIAIMLVVGTEDSFVKSRFALAEAKRASELLADEKKEILLYIAKNFGWDIKSLDDVSFLPYVFALNFPFFLKNATGFNDSRWKLINQRVVNGRIFLTKQKISRLLEEEIRKYIESRLDTKIKSLPSSIMGRVNKLKQIAAEKREQIQLEEMPDRIVMEAFPPCINSIYDRVSDGRPASHLGRFALTSFLLSIGMSADDVFKFFRSVSDFNERMTRYQVEHIAGTRGSGTKYTPPNCSTLRTHGICISPISECKGAVNPLVCYKRLIRNFPEENKAKN